MRLKTFCLLTTLAVAYAPHSYSQEKIKLIAPDGAPEDEFGNDVAIEGALAVVGASYNDELGDNSGSVYLMDIDTGLQRMKLTASDGGVNHFLGLAVDIHQSKVLATTFGPTVDGGAAYLFDANSGLQEWKMVPEDDRVGDRFGESAALYGNLAIVGAPRDDEQATDAGAAYVFDIRTGEQVHKLTAADGTSEDIFGTGVAIYGNRAIVGAPFDDEAAGAAYLFDLTTGQLLAKFTASDGQVRDYLGWAVGISEDIIALGAFGVGDTGAVYIYDATTFQLINKLVPAGTAGFGLDIEIDGPEMVVGAPNDSEQGTYAGAAFLVKGPQWTEYEKILPSDGSSRDHFGAHVGLDGNTILVGADWDDENGWNSGSAYAFCFCPDAQWTVYGSGWPGTLGVPQLTPLSPPIVGQFFQMTLENSLGQETTGFLMLGASPADLPTPFGGTLLLQPFLTIALNIPASGLTFLDSIPNDPGLCQATLFLQAIESDPGASVGLSFTPGLELVLGE